jgi:hypothetical protein
MYDNFHILPVLMVGLTYKPKPAISERGSCKTRDHVLCSGTNPVSVNIEYCERTPPTATVSYKLTARGGVRLHSSTVGSGQQPIATINIELARTFVSWC